MPENTDHPVLPAVGQFTVQAHSAPWPSAEQLEVTVVVATHNRCSFLTDLLTALQVQMCAQPYELVIVDDASSDATWERLQALVRVAEFPVLAVRIDRGAGPSVARNTGAVLARGRWLAFTDDDCLPEPGWLRALVAASPGVDLVQGRTCPVDGGRPSAWARTIRVGAPTALFETCNLLVRREAFLDARGFPVLDLLPGSAARGFGEDAALGSRVSRVGGRAFAPGAVVRHRWLAGTFADHLRGEWRLHGFPALAAHVPELDDVVWRRFFLTRRTAKTDAALAGLVAAVVLRRGWPALIAAPWVVGRLRDANGRGLHPAPLGAVQLMTGDLVGLVALAWGSLHARRLVV